MNNDKERIKQAAQGREIEILADVAGIDRAILDGKHHACPCCGGTDRFRLVDADAGAVLCNQCFSKDNGDFIAAVQWAKDLSFPDALAEIADYLGIDGATPTKRHAPAVIKEIPYIYTDESGNDAYKVTRRELADVDPATGKRKKAGFIQCHKTPTGWAAGLGTDADGKKRSFIPFPYRLDRLQRETVKTVLFVEGEKCADAAQTVLDVAGLKEYAATTVAGGSNNWKHLDELARYFAGLAVILLPDNDAPGRKALVAGRDALDAGREENDLQGVEYCFFDTLPDGSDAPEKYDIADYIDAERLTGKPDQTIGADVIAFIDQHKRDEWTDITPERNATPPKQSQKRKLTPILTPLSEIKTEKIDWLWRDRFQQGALSVINGKPGSGKTFMTCYMAAKITHGASWDDGRGCSKGSVLFFPGEENVSQVLKPRLEAAGADISLINILGGVKDENDELSVTLENDFHDCIRQAITDTAKTTGYPVQMVVIDPLGDYWGAIKENSNAEVRAAFRGLRSIAEDTGAAFIIVHHTGKADRMNAIDAGLGSTAINSTARSVWTVTRTKAEPDTAYFTWTKGNSTINRNGLTYSIEDNHAVMKDTEYDQTTDGLNSDIAKQEAQRLRNERSTKNPQKMSEAEIFLMNLLADGPRPVGDRSKPEDGTVYAECRDAGFGRSVIQNASKKIEVVSYKSTENGRYYWTLPQVLAQPST